MCKPSQRRTRPSARALTRRCRREPDAAALAQAYEFCARLARSHYENFTVASWLMPRAMRPHMHAIYAYARMADDFADEDHDLAKLDEWERELDLAYAGTPRHPVFVALADTVRRFDIPREPFADLLRAFRSDVDFQRLRDPRRPARLLALLGQSGRPPGALPVRLSRRRAPASLRPGLQRTCSSPTSGRTSRSISKRGESIFRAMTWRGSA